MFWTVNVDGGPSGSGNVSVAVRDRIYSFGGNFGRNHTMICPMDVQILQTDTYRWTVLKSQNYNEQIPCLRRGHTAVLHDDLVYIWGGTSYRAYPDEAAYDVLFCFNTTTHLWSKPTVSGMIPASRFGHSACVIDDFMYIFGGLDKHSRRFFQDVNKLNLKSLHWSKADASGVPPIYRTGHSATAIQHRMYIFGGFGSDGAAYDPTAEDFYSIYCNQIIYLDTVTLKWMRPELNGLYQPAGRFSHSAFCYKDQLFIFIGWNCNGPLNELVRYEPDPGCWSIVEPRGKAPCPREGHCCGLIGDRVFLFGGVSQLPTIADPDDDDGEIPMVDRNDLHVLDFEPSLKTLAIMTTLEHQLDQDELPQTIQSDIKAMTLPKCDVMQTLNNAGECS